MITVSTPQASAMCSTTWVALDDVQVMRLGLHVGRGVHIGDDREVRVALTDQAHVGAGDRGRERAARARVGDKHRLVRAQDFRGFGHEVHASLDNNLGVRAGSFARQLEQVAEIADELEHVRRHVVVRKDDGVLSASSLLMWKTKGATAGHSSA